MKRKFLLGCLVLMALAAVTMAYAGGKAKMDLKVGDELYVCACGEKCPCDTLSRNAGKCTCGVDLVKGKVTGVAEGSATISIDGKERKFKTVGVYVCACGEKCPCDFISQNPGKCTCGVELKKAI
jgi:hypothetical protein